MWNLVERLRPRVLRRVWLVLWIVGGLAQAAPKVDWPDVSRPAPAQGGGEKDAAVVVGAEKYLFVAPVPGAEANADDWYRYLTETRKVPVGRVRLVRSAKATRESLLKEAAWAAGAVQPGGKVWFVFVGHGAPAADGKDGVLVGVDAQQDVDSLYARSVSQRELLGVLEAGAQAQTVAVLDACFSGRSGSGAQLVPGMQPVIPVLQSATQALVLTAARGDEFAGPLPGLPRPAFSYLLLGALRGWAAGGDGDVTAQEALEWVGGAMQALVQGRSQTPQLLGSPPGTVLASRAREAAPDIASLVLAARPTGSSAASELSFGTGVTIQVPRIEVNTAAAGLKDINLEVERLLESALDAEERNGATPEEKSAAWCKLAGVKERNAYQAKAQEGCRAWREYGQKLRQQEEALSKDYATLAGYLGLRRKTPAQKLAVLDAFLAAYGGLPDSAAAKAVSGAREALAAGQTPQLPEAFGAAASAASGGGLAALGEYVEPRSGLTFVRLPAGTFRMGCAVADTRCFDDEKPAHDVSVAAFALGKTEVTVAAYAACAAAGACPSAIKNQDNEQTRTCNWRNGRDTYPINCINWEEAVAFCRWIDGRLPTAAEWEYAAKGGRDVVFPWGNEPVDSRLANFCDVNCVQALGDSDRAVWEKNGWIDRSQNDGWAGTSPVGSFPAGASRWGFLDMSGNTWEWTGSDYNAQLKELRGGGWAYGPRYFRASYRYSLKPEGHFDMVGFRCAR